MKKWFKVAFVALIVYSAVALGFSYASQVPREDLRDYYPFGLYVSAHRLAEKPATYTVLTNDTYIQRAVENGNRTWVQQDDPSSEYVGKGKPQYILWLPDGNYYLISKAYIDGGPQLPERSSLLTVVFLLLPWGGLFVAAGVQQKKESC